MQHFADSRFWRGIAVALVAALFTLSWGLASERTLLPVARAGGVVTGPGGGASVVYTTDETGAVLYVWYPGGAYFEKWSYELGQVSRRQVQRIDLPHAPPPGGAIPPAPGGTPSGRTPDGNR